MSYNIVVEGLSWGDEAKSRVINDWSEDFDFIIRYSGGNNCGGKVLKQNKEYIHHLLPAVDYSKSKAKSFLASGMVIHLPSLLEEIQIMERDYPNIGKSIIVDPCAFIVKEEYIAEDKITGKLQGTTFKGIKQSYVSKVNRTGTRIYNLINENAEIITALKNIGVQFIPLLEMKEIFSRSKNLFEGNQGLGLDLERGLFPNITSSHTGMAGIAVSGFNFIEFDKRYGVAKGTYITRSGGAKKLPTEMTDEEAEIYIKNGKEFGNTTGRKRQCAFMDLVALKYACNIENIDALVLTKMDISNGQDKIKVCVSYNGKDRVFSPSEFENVIPEYIEIDGWKDAKDPKQIKQFISFVEEKVGVDVAYISAGVEKEDLIQVKRSWL